MVWKDTESVGCGWEACDDLLQKDVRQVLLVCHYYRQGNIINDNGKYLLENVGNKTEASNIYHEMLPENACLANLTAFEKEAKAGQGYEDAATSVKVNYGLMVITMTFLLGSSLFMPLVGISL